MAKGTLLTNLRDEERDKATQRFHIIAPFVEGRAALADIAREHHLGYSTLQRWAADYRRHGLVGLAYRRRSDRGKRRLPFEVVQLIEALALQNTKPSAAAIHRVIRELAPQFGWKEPSYSVVRDIVSKVNPALITLAHEGSKAYQQAYDLLYRREAERPNAIWQADHSPLNIWLLDEQEKPARPWLTAIEDDFSRCIAGYQLSFKRPTSLHTALALRQAIWRKDDPRWHICGIPEVFYTDHGSDFTSHHMEQVCIDLKIQLIFSTVGMPRGRGRVERFFRTIDQLFLHRLPGYAPEGKPLSPPVLTLSQFDEHFKTFLLDEYHQRPQKDLPLPPQARWEVGGFLPHMPESLEQLDLLLLTVPTARQVRRDGIHFQSYRYLDLTLAAYIGEEVVIRYDPRDMAEIRVYHQDRFLCRAVCQELAGHTISLKDIIQARNRRRRELRQTLTEHEALIQTYLDVHQPHSALPIPEPPETEVSHTRLRRYHNE